MKKRKQSLLLTENTPKKKSSTFSSPSSSSCFDNVVVDLIDDEEEDSPITNNNQSSQVIEILDENDERCKFTIVIEKKAIQNIKLDTSRAKITKQKTITNYFKKSVKMEKSTFNSYLVEAPSMDWFEKKRNVLDIRDVESNFKTGDSLLVPFFQSIGNNSSTLNIRSSDRKLTFKLDTMIECSDNLIYHHVNVPIQNKKSHPVCVSNNLCNSEKKVIPKLSLSFLKSLLQKNTRLGRAESCLRIASLMIYKYSFLEFLRRIQIIIVEDCLMHPCAHLITWLMIHYGSKEATTPTNSEDNNYSSATIPKIFIDACLQIVYDIAKVNYREDLSNCEMFISQDDMNSLFGSKSAQFSEFEEDLCRSLFIRSCFGGMKGDIVLLHSQCSLWLYRFSNRVSQPPTNSISKEYFIPEIFQNMLNPAIESGSNWFKYLCSLYYSEKRDSEFLSSFLKSKPSVDLLYEDVVLSAVDFHCFPALLGKCLDKFRELSPNTEMPDQTLMDVFKKIIWHKVSKLNIRAFVVTLPKEEPFEDMDWYSMEWDKSLDPFEEEIFQTIEPHIREMEADTFRQQCL